MLKFHSPIPIFSQHYCCIGQLLLLAIAILGKAFLLHGVYKGNYSKVKQQ